ncbi:MULTISPECIES: benenodin family lasso peptide [Sphingomonadaceae]|jgi:hypothetical protein|uniref:Benenodin family lasso peptide n=1 Tax=Sphingobium yanoikuyae TaxID=13690 RepID=A0AA42WPQ1_SPHYA|nr:benenodin family lasso peptide [Sphingobium yanoikuyae]MDH2129530.1 benenodin family lasso peptide [Sphingobium yanoikuyae]MDH2149041.1 benenodin family lasso peptide [Sphingobium yanoikuyae]MDH2167653.1 benenodin family lasso peptide [Sphingobium yanoikuyae]
MEREYEATDDGVVELGLATEVTQGQGLEGDDYPRGQPSFGLLED